MPSTAVLIPDDELEPEPEHILGIADTRTDSSNGMLHPDEADILAGIIDHGECPDEDEDDPDVIVEESDEDDMADDSRGLIDSNGVVELSPSTATVIDMDDTPSDLFGSPEGATLDSSSTSQNILPSDTTPEVGWGEHVSGDHEYAV